MDKVYIVTYSTNTYSITIGVFSSWEKAFQQLKNSILTRCPDGHIETNTFMCNHWQIIEAVSDYPKAIIHHNYSEFSGQASHRPSEIYKRIIEEIKNG
jgi:hypothetical protein